jgi:hypothetical protein
VVSQNYAPTLFDYLAKKLDPTTICDEIDACP